MDLHWENVIYALTINCEQISFDLNVVIKFAAKVYYMQKERNAMRVSETATLVHIPASKVIVAALQLHRVCDAFWAFISSIVDQEKVYNVDICDVVFGF